MGLLERLRTLTSDKPSVAERPQSDGLPDDHDRVDRIAIESLVGARVANIELYDRALRHKSLLRGESDAHLYSNERLEYLGDAVLGFVVAEVLYEAFPGRAEGFLTRMRAKLVNGRQLAASAQAIGLGQHIHVGDSLASTADVANESILSDAFEAIIGAVYLDLGLEHARRFINRALLTSLDLSELAERRDNFKSLLLETMQARGQAQPRYRVLSETGPSHEKEFEVAVLLGGTEYGRGRARSKKRAEQAAAELALERIRTEDKA